MPIVTVKKENESFVVFINFLNYSYKKYKPMKKSFLLSIIVFVSISLKAQEWDNPAVTNDWNNVWQSSFIESLNATNAPESSGWFWGA